MSDDSQLLQQFVQDHSEVAFAELVERHLNLVYSAALRQVGGDSHLARDVTQNVFLALAQNAARVVHHSALTGWLYTTTHFISAKLVRGRQRRRAREETASAMNEILQAGRPDPDWYAMWPVIDAAMHKLSAADREAVLLRHFEGRPFAEIGVTLGVGENAARMRVDRALQKLRAQLARRGITSTAAALGAALTAHGTVSAPAGLASAAAALSFAGAATTAAGASGMLMGLHFMGATHFKVAAVGMVVALAVGGYLGAQWQRGRAFTPAVAVKPIRPGADARADANAKGVDATKQPRARKGTGSSMRVDAAEHRNATAAADAFPALDATTQRTLLQSARAGLDQRYGLLFRRLKLPLPEFEQLRGLLAEREVSNWDAVSVAQAHGINILENANELKTITEKVRADIERNIQSLLGDERYREYQDYNDKASSYVLLDQIERRLSYSDAPLQQRESAALFRLLVDSAAAGNNSAEDGPLGTVSKTFGGDPMVAAMMRLPMSDAMIAQAQSFLAPTQIEILRGIQAEQRSQVETMKALGKWPPGVVTDPSKDAPSATR